MRLFYAIEIPELIKHSIIDKLTFLKGLGNHIRTVRPDGLHLTMLFLGDQNSSDVPELLNIGGVVTSAARPCELMIGPVGFFPRVSFLTLTGELATLHVMSGVLKQMATNLLEKPDSRPFKAHVTLARHKQRITPDEKNLIAEIFADCANKKWIADELTLFESELTPQGAIYTVVEKFKFSG